MPKDISCQLLLLHESPETEGWEYLAWPGVIVPSGIQVSLCLERLEIFHLKSFLRNCFRSGAWVYNNFKSQSVAFGTLFFCPASNLYSV